MATVFKAGNATSGASFTPDSTGILEFRTGSAAGGITAMTIDASQNITTTGNLTVTGTLNVAVTSPIQPITASVATNALTVTLNATNLSFRSATLSSGTVNSRNIITPISIVVSSGSTLGTVSATQSRIVVIAIDNAGTVELAVVNMAGGNNLDETTLITTTAEGGAGGADSINTIYSTTARTSVPFRVVGYIESTQATAGTWATAPSTIQGAGGNAVTAMSSIGYGQTWQNTTRTAGTTYYNTTGKPITFLFIVATTAGAVTFTINSFTTPTINMVVGATYSIIIPPNAAYSINNAGGAQGNTLELR
jgi:hypothetical protein